MANKETNPKFFVIKVKESNEDNETINTFIGASTLPDRVSEMLPNGEKIEGEILSKNVLDKFAGFINDTSRMGGKYGSYRTISLFHDRVINKDYTREEAGFVVPSSAKVLEMTQENIPSLTTEYPGNYALVLDTKTNKMYNPPTEYDDYTPEKIEYKIKNNALGLSLEYNNTPEQERIVKHGDGLYRFIMDSDDFRGFGFARPDLIGNPTAVRIKEIYPQINKKGENIMENDKDPKVEAKLKELSDANTKIKELQDKLDAATKIGEETKIKEFKDEMSAMETKIKELKLENDAYATKLKESIDLAFSGIKFEQPAKAAESKESVKLKEIYNAAEAKDWIKFKELANEHIDKNDTKLKELLSRDGAGFDFEKFQTLKVKCNGSQMIVVPSAKTKDTLDATAMAESTYYQTNAMFADRYVSGITETFLKEDTFLKVIPKEQFMGGNDKYQWKIWSDYGTVTGDSTFAVNPNVTSVTTSRRTFEKMETRICEYRDAVEVTDFTQYHSMAAVGDLLGIELQRAAEVVTESMNADLFKPKVDNTSGWWGFVGLLGVADSSTYSTMYGKVRSATNRLLDSTTANTYVTTSEGINVELVRSGYEKVLAHGSNLANIIITAHPTQVRRLFNSEEAAIRNQILTMSGAPATFGFNRSIIPHIDGIPIIRDYRCESSAAAADMFAVVDISPSKGFNLVVSKPLGARGLAKVGLSEKAYVNFWGCTVYKSPRNVFVHDSLTST